MIRSGHVRAPVELWTRRAAHRALERWARLSGLVLAFFFILAAPWQAAANASDGEPDLFLVNGRDWRVVLPASVLAAGGEQAVPLLLPEEGKEEWFEHFVSRHAPTRPLLLEYEGAPALTPWEEEAPAGVDENDTRVEAIRLSARPLDLARLLADRLVSRPGDGDAGPPFWLVDSSDYPAGLLAAVAAGAEGGVLLPVGPGEVGVEKALELAASRRSPIRFAGVAETEGRSLPASVTRLGVLSTAEAAGMEVETILGIDELTKRAVLAFEERRGELPRHVVMTNPGDTRGWFSPPHLSLLSPLFAIARRAPLVLTEGEPEDLERDLSAFQEAHGDVSHVTLIGDYLALRMRQKLDPDDLYEGVEEPRAFKVPALVGVTGLSPAEYAVGRLAAEDVNDLSLQLGRILAPRRSLGSAERSALMLANADEIFVMAELVSIATVKEMENAGWEVAAHYGDTIDSELIFRELPGKEVIVWTGHPRDLTVDYDIGVVDQRLDATLVFLQGCYTLDRNDPYVLVQQGAASVIGTYMAVYSASGSAFAKTVLDAMLYHGADQGEAMVHARNYLLAYVAMKKQRGHQDWRKTWRGALSFDLWGDPTATTVPPRRSPEMPPVRLVHEGDSLRFDAPEGRFTGISAGRYTLESAPGAQLGAIYTRSDEWGPERRMQPFYFGWVELPEHESEPSLETEVPEDEWVSLWSPHRRRLYLMLHNRAERSVGRENLVFRIAGEGGPEVAEADSSGEDDQEEPR